MEARASRGAGCVMRGGGGGGVLAGSMDKIYIYVPYPVLSLWRATDMPSLQSGAGGDLKGSLH